MPTLQKQHDTPESLFAKTANQGMLLFQDDVCIYKDRKTYTLLGYTRDQINAIPHHLLVDRMVYKQDRQVVMDIIANLSKPESVEPFKSKIVQMRIISFQQQVKWLEVVVKKIIFNQKPTVLILISNIDKQKQAKSEIVRSKIIYQTIFESTSSGIILSEADMTIRYVNNRFCQLVGKTKKEVEGKVSWTNFVAEKDRAKMMKYHYWRRIKSHKPPRSYEFDLIDRIGQFRRCIATVSLIPGTRITVASFLDISDRVKSALATEQSKKLFKSAFYNAPLGIFLIDKDLTVEQANRTGLKIFNLTKNQIIDQKLNQLIVGHLLPKEFRQLCCTRKEHSLPEVPFTTVAGKELWLQMICSRTNQNNNSSAWMVMVQDVTETVTAKKLIEDLPNRILQAHEDEKQTLSQEIHDTFSQSLAALKMSMLAALVRQTPAIDRSGFNEVLSQIDSLINLSRSIAHNLRPEIIDKLGLVAAIRNLTKEMSLRAGFLIQLKTNVQDIQLSPLIALQLFRITQEAINNAIKHSRASMIAVVLKRQDGHLLLMIRDNGKGFDAKEVDKQLIHKKSLGLKIINERANKIEAACTIRSVVGQGTSITVNCPLRAYTNKK